MEPTGTYSVDAIVEMRDDVFAMAIEHLVEARLEQGRMTARTLLDTGATRTFIAPRLAKQLPECRSTDPQEMAVRLADGNLRSLKGHLYTFSFQLDKEQEPTNIKAMCWDGMCQRYDLLVGMDYLPQLWSRGGSAHFNEIMGAGLSSESSLQEDEEKGQQDFLKALEASRLGHSRSQRSVDVMDYVDLAVEETGDSEGIAPTDLVDRGEQEDSWEIKAGRECGVDLHAKSYEDIRRSAPQKNMDKQAALYVKKLEDEFDGSAWRDVAYVSPKTRVGPDGKPFRMHLTLKPDAKPVLARVIVEKPDKAAAKRVIVQGLLKAGVIEPSTSAWRQACFLVPKPAEDGKPDPDMTKWRFIVDLRPSNKALVFDAWPCPSLAGVHQGLASAKIISELDLSSAFFQLELDQDSRAPTAFACDDVLYQFCASPMGCSNSVQALARWLVWLLRDFMVGEKSKVNPGGRRCLQIYVDNLYIYSDSGNVEEHYEDLRAILKVMSADDIVLKRNKSHLFMTAVKCLGFFLGGGHIYPDADKVKAMRELPEPRKVRELRGCLGLFQFYSRFVPRYTEKVINLQELTRKGVKWTWGPAERKDFLTIKDALVKAVPLKLPFVGAKYRVQSDASSYSVGGTLSLFDEDKEAWAPVEFFSMKLNRAQRGYHIYRKESIGLAACVARWKGYLIARPFILETDSAALSCLMTKDPKQLLDREARLIEELGILQFELRHVPGQLNTADIFSRLPGTGLAPWYAWDLGSGSGSFLRGLQSLVRDPTAGLVERKLVMYQSVEIEPWARAATRKVYEAVLDEHPFLFGHTIQQATRYGHCVRKLLQHPDVLGGRVRADHVCFGVPCQPFSTAQKRAPGLRDKRQLFTVVCDLLHAFLRNPANAGLTFTIECVCFGIRTHSPHLEHDLAAIDAMFAQLGGRRTQVAMHGRWTGARRNRFIWTNVNILPLPDEDDKFTFAAVLEQGWRPANVRKLGQKDDPYAATLMASANSDTRKTGKNDLITPEGQRVTCPLEIEERLMGLRTGDTDVRIRDTSIPRDQRVRLIGNAIPVPAHTFLLRRAMERLELALFAPGDEEESVNYVGDLAGPRFEELFRASALNDSNYQSLLARSRAQPSATKLSVLDGRLYDQKGRCVVPRGNDLRQMIISTCHEDPHAGHPGQLRTIQRVEDYWVWDSLRRDVSDFVRTCQVCQRTKPSQARKQGNLFPLSVSYPGEALSMDFFQVEPFTGRDQTGRRVTVDKVWAVIDQFSKYTRLIPLESTESQPTSERLVEIYMRDLLPVFGVPRSISSDNDVLFRANFWAHFLQALGVRQNLITEYRPQGNGQAENTVRTSLGILRSVLNSGARNGPQDWFRALPVVELVINTSVHSVTRFTPAELHFGRRFALPLPFVLPHTGLQDLDSTANDIMRQVRDNTKLALQRLKKANQDAMDRALARGGTDSRREFVVGQEVLLAPARAAGVLRPRGQKMRPCNMGPYVVINRLVRDGTPMDTYRIRDRGLPDSQGFTVNADRLSPYTRSDGEVWRLERQQVPHENSHVARFNWDRIDMKRDWDFGNNLPPRYSLRIATRRGYSDWYDVEETGVHLHPQVAPQVTESLNIGPWTLALQAIQAYEQQRGLVVDFHMPEENSTGGQQCKAHVTLLRNLPSTDAVPQYERDEHNSLRLQEHWRVALRGLQD